MSSIAWLNVKSVVWGQRADSTLGDCVISGSERAGGGGVLWQDLCDAPVLGLHGRGLHQLQIQNPLMLAALVNPVVAAKHIPDVGGQMQHVDIPEQHRDCLKLLSTRM